jgi:phosphohistidine phosphatase
LTKEIPFHNLNNNMPEKRGIKMELYLIQHGEAKSEVEDPERSLTASGEKEVMSVSKVALSLHIRPSKVYHSGKLRAKQTAEIIAGALKIPNPLIQSAQGLNPNDNIHPWAERISKEEEDLMLVGHLPFLEKLTSFLLCGNENARLVWFRYGAIICLYQKEDKGWAVRWILTPEMASQLHGHSVKEVK